MNKELLDKVVSLHTEIDNVGKKIEGIKFAALLIEGIYINKDDISYLIERYEANLADLQAELNRYEIVDSVPTIRASDSPDFYWAKYVVTDIVGKIYAHEVLPIKGRIWWYTEPIDRVKEITSEQAMELCGRVPKWEDDEPTPVINK